MGIEIFRKIATELKEGGRLDEALFLEGKKLKSERPLKPPSGWGHFQGHQVNSQGHAPAAAHAREISGLRCFAGFLQAVRERYGNDITDMCVRTCNLTGLTPLTARTVSEVIALADAQLENRVQNSKAVTRFLDASRWSEDGAAAGGSQALKNLVSKEAHAFISAYVNKLCASTQAFTTDRLDEGQIAAIADEALALCRDLVALPGLDWPMLGAVLKQAAKLSGVAEMRQAVQEQALVLSAKCRLDLGVPNSFLSTLVANFRARAPGLELRPSLIKGRVAEALKNAQNSSAAMSKEYLPGDALLNASQQINATLKKELGQALTRQFFGVSGQLGGAFHTQMANLADVPLSETEQATTALGNHTVGQGFLKDAGRNLTLLAPGGMPMVDRRDWTKISADERTQRIVAGYEQLISLCGSEEKARAWSMVLSQRLTSPFIVAQQACGAELSPLRMWNGASVNPVDGTDPVMEVGFLKGSGGELRIGFSYRLPCPAKGQEMDSDRSFFLDRENSYFSYSYEARLGEEGRVLIDSPASYAACLMPTAWKRDYPEPLLSGLLRGVPKAMEADLLAFAHDNQAEDLVQGLIALHHLRSNPSREGLRKLSGMLAKNTASASGEARLPEGLDQLGANDATLLAGLTKIGENVTATINKRSLDALPPALMAFNSAIDAVQKDFSQARALALYDAFLAPGANAALLEALGAGDLGAYRGWFAEALVDNGRITALIEDLVKQLGTDIFPRFVATGSLAGVAA